MHAPSFLQEAADAQYSTIYLRKGCMVRLALDSDDVMSEGVVTAGRGLCLVSEAFSAPGEGSHGISILSAVGEISIGVASSLAAGLAGGRGSSSTFEFVGVMRASAGI